jgi:hypothetical protein
MLSSSLTDAELYLLDALFDVSDRLGMLNHAGFRSSNLLCPFELDDAAWEARAQQLVERGLLRSRPAQDRPDLGPWISLTPAGGALWESVRRPDWSRFCEVSSQQGRVEDPWILRVRSHNRDVADAFLIGADACGLFAPDFTRIRRRETSSKLVPWKSSSRVFELRVPLIGPDDGSPRLVDWTEYERRRTWWRDVRELLAVS